MNLDRKYGELSQSHYKSKPLLTFQSLSQISIFWLKVLTFTSLPPSSTLVVAFFQTLFFIKTLNGYHLTSYGFLMGWGAGTEQSESFPHQLRNPLCTQPHGAQTDSASSTPQIATPRGPPGCLRIADTVSDKYCHSHLAGFPWGSETSLCKRLVHNRHSSDKHGHCCYKVALVRPHMDTQMP